MDIVLGLPAHKYSEPECTYSLLNLQAWSLRQTVNFNQEPTRLALHPITVIGCRIDMAREQIADQAIAMGAAALLWVDDDMAFPPDALLRLMAHNVPVVGCNYPARSPGYAGQRVSSAQRMTEGEMRPIEPRSDGLEEVDLIGLGLCLMKTSVFGDVPRPWFSMTPKGEDGELFAALAEKGIKPVVDHGLSAEVRHIVPQALGFGF